MGTKIEDRKVAKKTYQPLNTKVVISIIQAANQTESGLVIPETSRHRMVTTRAVVVACGPDVKQVKEGDVVLIGLNQAPELIRHRGEETLVVDEMQLYGIELSA
jgi:co-chaperonin GroES (HSP10)